MGIVHVHRGRLAPTLVLVALAVLVLFAVSAQAALAAHPDSPDTWKHADASSCTSCHASMSGPGANPDNTLCTKCHGSYVPNAKAGATAKCWSACHYPGQPMGTVATNNATAGCGATAAGAGCHGPARHIGATTTTCVNCHGVGGQSAHHKTAVTDVTVKPVLTAKLSATSIKLGKTFKATGLARPINATYKVTVQIQKKVGTKWVKVTSKTVAPNATSYAWTVTYKPARKATYRAIATTPAVASTTTVGVTAVLKGTKTTKSCIVK